MKEFREYKPYKAPMSYSVHDDFKQGAEVTIKYLTDTKNGMKSIKKVSGVVVSIDDYITTIKLKHYCVSFINYLYKREREKA